MLFLLLPAEARADTGTVVRVIDGDTLVLALSDLRAVTVRLYGIDCPEGRQETGDEATAFVRRMAEGEFFIQRLGEDRYGRIVAILYFPGGRSLQEAILAAGYAWIAPRYCKRPECLEWKVLETQALKEKRGLWRHPRPLPPWQWRKQQLGGKHE